MKQLKALLNGIAVIEVQGSLDGIVNQIQFDSRQIKKGDLFVAQRGVHVDGHIFIGKAIELGATSVVCEEFPVSLQKNITYVKVKNAALALGHLASKYYDDPSRYLKLVGVTGTNGKTTTATLLYKLVGSMGYKAGLLSTVCNCIGEEQLPATHTTPDA